MLFVGWSKQMQIDDLSGLVRTAMMISIYGTKGSLAQVLTRHCSPPWCSGVGIRLADVVNYRKVGDLLCLSFTIVCRALKSVCDVGCDGLSDERKILKRQIRCRSLCARCFQVSRRSVKNEISFQGSRCIGISNAVIAKDPLADSADPSLARIFRRVWTHGPEIQKFGAMIHLE
jgi:hypothetical protein